MVNNTKIVQRELNQTKFRFKHKISLKLFEIFFLLLNFSVCVRLFLGDILFNSWATFNKLRILTKIQFPLPLYSLHLFLHFVRAQLAAATVRIQRVLCTACQNHKSVSTRRVGAPRNIVTAELRQREVMVRLFMHAC